MRFFLFLITLVLFGAGAQASDVAYEFPTSERYVLPTLKAPDILKQCSRGSPQNVSGYWVPDAKDIDALEKALMPYLQDKAQAYPPKGMYARQYAGIVVQGKKLIYGNFYRPEVDIPDQGTTPMIVCDGGPVFWGIVYDPETKKFSDLSFNGAI